MIHRTQHDKDHPYVMINKDFLDDPNLSLKAKGLLAYCLSKPDGWSFYIDQMSEVLKESRYALNAAFKELIEFRYCVQYQPNINGCFGKMERIIFERPRTEEELKKLLPRCDFPQAENPQAENQQLVNNNILNNDNNVVVAREPAHCDFSKKKLFLEEEFTKDDLYATCLRAEKDWTSPEMEEAWTVYKKTTIPISSPFDYIEGIIKKQRIMRESKNQKENKRTKLCKKKRKKTKAETKMIKCNQESKSLNSDASEKGMLTRPFQNWTSILNMQQ